MGEAGENASALLTRIAMARANAKGSGPLKWMCATGLDRFSRARSTSPSEGGRPGKTAADRIRGSRAGKL